MNRLKILSIGEILWDVIADAEHLGGAPFNFAVHATRLGHRAWLLSAVGDDELGRRAIDAAQLAGVDTSYLETSLQAETGVAVVSADADGLPAFEIVRPGAYDFLTPNSELLAGSFDAICYGTLLQTFEPARRATKRVLDNFPKAHRFYDVNLRAGHYELPLVEDLMSRATIVKLNEAEAEIISGGERPLLREFCETQATLFGLSAVAVTRGENGCALYVNGEYVEAPGIRVPVIDTVGSGDAFGAAFLHGISEGWDPPRIAEFANRVGALVASKAGGTPDWNVSELEQLGAVR